MPASWATFTTTMAASPAPPQFLIRSSHLKFLTCFMLCGMMVFENRSSSSGDGLATFITLEVDFLSLCCNLHFSILLSGNATLSWRKKPTGHLWIQNYVEPRNALQKEEYNFQLLSMIWDLQLNCNLLLQGGVEQMGDTFHLELQWGNATIVMEFSIRNIEAPCYVMILCTLCRCRHAWVAAKRLGWVLHFFLQTKFFILISSPGNPLSFLLSSETDKQWWFILRVKIVSGHCHWGNVAHMVTGVSTPLLKLVVNVESRFRMSKATTMTLLR